MKPTPTETPCPPLSNLRRLLQPDLPEAEAASLRDHLGTCPSCRQVWHNLQAETVAGQTPSVFPPANDTSHGQPVLPPASSAMAWSSEIFMEGPGGQRQPAQPSPPAPSTTRRFSFLSPPRGADELGWLGHYRVTGVLGEGGMGFVFDAFDTSLYRRVALKVLKPELAANASFRERFLLEARAAAALPDEYIITIYQVGVENDVPFLAMKLLYGESLEQRLQRDGRLPPLEILRIGREIALGLSAAHDRGLIHRDIKPANLWLEAPPPEPGAVNRPRLSFENVCRLKILDFGLARPINDSRRLTATGLIVGTPQYLAPEQARGQPLDHRCDLFSLGIVLYRMATGILPFDGADTLAQLTALAVTEPQPVEELSSDVPEGLRQLIHQLLARDPAKRPQTARAVAETLRALEKSEMHTVPLVEGREGRAEAPIQHSPSSTLHSPRSGWRGWFLYVGKLWSRPKHRRAESDDRTARSSKASIKVGVLFSRSGTMANGGEAARDAALLALDELNEQGGLIGRNVEAVDVDGESDYRKFAEEAENMILKDRVCAIFGTRASLNRKAVKDVVEKHNNLLFYPMQFEGLEESPNIIYLGAAPNQQIIPAVDYMLGGERGKSRLFLVGSDYVFPRAANALLRDYVTSKYPDAEILEERYIPFGSMDVQETIRAIQETKPDLILNTINGDSNCSFFRALYEAGRRDAALSAQSMPVMSFSMGENDLRGIGKKEVVGHYAAWSYFQSIDRPENHEFVRKFGSRGVVSDPMETIYFGVRLWAKAVQAAGSAEPRKVLESIKGLELEAPEGRVRIDRDTRYTWRAMRIGRINTEGQFEIVFDTDWPIRPEPFPSSSPRAKWQRFLEDLYAGWGNSWIAGGKK